jgi:2-polyprenyl-3-methyl-5-hydroxy-6-metoxy-1,4-benzoquinol methylase
VDRRPDQPHASTKALAFDSNDEIRRLDAVAADSWYARGSNAASLRFSAELLRPYWKGSRCLELGPAEGLVTAALAQAFPDLTLVDGSAEFCALLRNRFPEARVIQTLFEEYRPDGHFDTIVLGHVLEHVDDPVGLLGAVRSWLGPDGVVTAVVPNANSLHRQAAVLMGLLSDIHELNETDRHHAHRRVYDPEGFRNDFLTAGLTVEEFGGYWLKPLSMAQIDSTWTPIMIDAFMRLGQLHPNIAAEMYIIARA